MKRDRVKNRADERWAHPELVMYLIPEGDAGFRGLEDMDAGQLEARREPMRGPMREVFEQTASEVELNGAVWEERWTEGNSPEEPDGPAVRMLVRRPIDLRPEERLPCIFYLPGGGLAHGGTPECAMQQISDILVLGGLRAIAVSPEYRIAPNTQYPACINDCQAAFAWMVEHSDELGVDRDRIVISGGSSGGHLALSVTFRLKDYGYHGVSPRGVIPIIPVMSDVTPHDSGRISFEIEDGSIAGWDVNTISKCFGFWLGDRKGDPTLPPEAVPSRATIDDVKGYPPVWFPCCAELDCARDPVYDFASLLHEVGVFCEVHMWGGCSHPMFIGPNETDFTTRVWKVICGAYRDAIQYDFRRPWLTVD